MITLPSVLQKVMESNNLAGLKPFAYLFRNKWDSVAKKYALESTPIDISEFIVKPNTLSMTLDVNEVAQYNANNVTITLTDTDNRFVEGTKNSYFPAGYQIYGSRVVLYYGLDSTNQTSIFTGVIKDLPTYKPEKYQVDLKLVSPLEMLKDIEAKDFSDKVTGEELHYEHQDDDSHRVYSTAGTGVGGFDAVYADGVKLFEGVDYETEQMNELYLPALVTIINDDYQNATITSDYYTWKTGLTVEQIVAGLVGLAGYDSGTEDIQSVVWNTAVRSPDNVATVWAALGYYLSGTNEYTWGGSNYSVNNSSRSRTNILPSDFDLSFSLKNNIRYYKEHNSNFYLHDASGQNGLVIQYYMPYVVPGSSYLYCNIYKLQNGSTVSVYSNRVAGAFHRDFFVGNTFSANFKIERRGNDAITKIYFNDNLVATLTSDVTDYTKDVLRASSDSTLTRENERITFYDNTINFSATLNGTGIVTVPQQKDNTGIWGAITATKSNENPYFLNVYFSDDENNWTGPLSYRLDTVMAKSEEYMIFAFGAVDDGFNITNPSSWYASTNLVLNLVNLSGKTVLEALQDFALISGYEFGVNRNGVFFFRPRVQSTNPIYTLGADELVKIDTVKRNLSDFFTKLTLTFAQVPLEFYANTGTRPTPVDKYGVINKEIDKPDIVNYDNPELAQAIGPQLLEVYSALPNMLQAVGKLNLALELADIVQVDRNYNLVQPDSASDYDKYVNQQTYYRACKITGMNYNFEKKQITYTLRDVSNSNNVPYVSAYGFVYSLPIRLGTRK